MRGFALGTDGGVAGLGGGFVNLWQPLSFGRLKISRNLASLFFLWQQIDRAMTNSAQSVSYSLHQTDFSDDFLMLEVSRSSTAFSNFQQLVRESGFQMKDWAEWLGLSENKLKHLQVVEPKMSEQILSIARLIQLGNQVFESPEVFKDWLGTDVLALGKKKPKQFINNSFGIKIVSELLLRIEHGSYS